MRYGAERIAPKRYVKLMYKINHKLAVNFNQRTV